MLLGVFVALVTHATLAPVNTSSADCSEKADEFTNRTSKKLAVPKKHADLIRQRRIDALRLRHLNGRRAPGKESGLNHDEESGPASLLTLRAGSHSAQRRATAREFTEQQALDETLAGKHAYDPDAQLCNCGCGGL